MQLVIIAIILSRLQCIRMAELPQHGAELLQLVQRIHQEKYFDTLLVYGSDDCVFHALLRQLQLPVVLLPKGSSSFAWQFNNDALLLGCAADAEQEQHEQLQLKLQLARRLIYLEAEVSPEELCETYLQREQPNVLMLHAATGNVYRCCYFQAKNHVQLHPEDPLYVEQFANMQGAIIRSEVDQLAPRSMLYSDPITGEVRMIGYVANLVNTFVERRNATLRLRQDYEFGKIVYYGVIEELAKKNLIDVGTAMASTLGAQNLDYLSYPYLLSSYCFMVPVPAPLPYKQIYTVIVDPLVMGLLLLLFLLFSLLLIYSPRLSWQRLGLANVLLNDRCLRGLLGQSFPLPAQQSRHLKAICTLLCFASIMTTTMYECYLQSFFTHPPPEPSLHTFADVRASRYRVALDRREAALLLQSYNIILTNAQHIVVLDDWNEFVHMRDTFNASFIYPVTKLRWETYAEQQRIFERPAFYYSDDICLRRYILLCVPVRRHLPYRHLFELHQLQTQQFGLLKFWIERSFFEMVRLRLTPLEDFSEWRPYEDALYVRDISWILQFYLFAHLLASLCFVIELGWHWVRQRRARKQRLRKV